MIKKLGSKSEADLITEVSSLAEAEIDQATVKFYLENTMDQLRHGGKSIELAAGPLRGWVLQRITRDEEKRRKAADLVIQLLGYIGDSEAEYFSNHLNNMEAEFQRDGKSWFKKAQIISDLTNLSNSLDKKNHMKESDEVDSFIKEIATQDD